MNIDHKLDNIFRHLDENFDQGNFKFVDWILKNHDPRKHEIEITVGVLMATFPAKNELNYREALLNKFKSHLIKIKHPEANELIPGLC